MIIANGVPKSGTTLLVTYLRCCGCIMEPGGLIADRHGMQPAMEVKEPWGKGRTFQEIMDHEAIDRVVGAHLHDEVSLPAHHKVAFIARHPRNVFISWARMVAPDDPGSLFTEPWMQMNIVRMRDFVGWFNRADAVIRYEQFADSVAELTAKLGLPYSPANVVLHDNAPWITPTYRGTWSGRVSDWQEHWNPYIAALWRNAGGREIESAYGY